MKDKSNNPELQRRRTCKLRLFFKDSMAWGRVCNLEEVKRLIGDFNDVYRIELKLADETYNVRTGFVQSMNVIQDLKFWVSDKITTPIQLAKEKPTAKLKPAITSENMDVPAIKTTISKSASHQLVKSWYRINPTSDIVVNRDLGQIFPRKTGAVPAILVNMLQHVK